VRSLPNRRRETDRAELALRRAIRARDAGLRRISAITRGIVAAALALTGGLAVLAAQGFHGHAASSATAQALAQPALSRPTAHSSAARSSTALRSTRGGAADTGVRTQTSTTPAQTTPAATTPAQTTPAQTTPAQTTPQQTTPAQQTAAGGSGSSLARPSQAPAQTPAAPVAVSGGS
jgi:cytoskeletal protein RodZ